MGEGDEAEGEKRTRERTRDQGQKINTRCYGNLPIGMVRHGKGDRECETMSKRDSITEAPTRYRTWTSHYPGECATDYTTGDKSGDTRG